MIVIDSLTFGDVACTRAGPGTYYDRNGVLQTAPANTLRVTYDPSDLSKAPYALVEPAATNQVALSAHFASWGKNGLGVSEGDVLAPDGTMAGSVVTVNATSGVGLSLNIGAAPATVVTYSIHFKRGNTDLPNTRAFGIYNFATNADLAYALVNYATGSASLVGPQGGSASVDVKSCGGGWYRLALTVRTGISVGDVLNVYGGATGGLGVIGETYCIWGAQLEAGDKARSYIPTAGAAVTRPADVIAPGAGLVYSNVAISEPDYNPAATYAKDALVHDPATHLTYQSLVAANTGRALTDITAWVKLEVTNRWKMLDKKNNTQTTNADEILLVLSPEDIAQGVYVGNVDASDVRSSVVDLTEGLVYSHTEEMTMLTAESGDFYEWCFGRIVRADYYATTDLPPYANALVTICLRKDGSTPKCGMAIAGPVDEFGPSLYGLSTGGEDFSTTTFDIDGVSETALHGYAKDMSVDVEVDNGDIDYLHTRLEAYRKKTVVWLGGPYGCTAVCGPYKSFKNVLKGLRKSLMSLEISGVV